MELNLKVLQKALYEMKPLHGYTHQEITKLSGVHNVNRIILGPEHEDGVAATARTWERLHGAFPDLIPPPTYIDGDQIYEQQSIRQRGKARNLHQSAGDMHINTTNQPKLPPELQTLVNTLLEKDTDKKLTNKFLLEALQTFTQK